MTSSATPTIQSGISSLSPPLNHSHQTDSYLTTGLTRTIEAIYWLIVNRGGFAFLTSSILVPSQYRCPNAEKSEEIINQAVRSNPASIEVLDLPHYDGNSLKCVIYYPKNFNRKDHSRCLIYNNPNCATVADFIKNGNLFSTPAKLLKLAKCPIIMYDYRGTGLNSSGNQTSRFFKYRPTVTSIITDGHRILDHALQNYKKVTTVGSSLGGAVATASLMDATIRKPPLDRDRVQLINHDSFTATTSVITPKWPKIASWIGWTIGALLDATNPMKNLIEQGRRVTILNHQNDPIIPRGAQMADFVSNLPKAENVSVLTSPEYGHAYLSKDMIKKLSQILK
jgi:hypothetical protein